MGKRTEMRRRRFEREMGRAFRCEHAARGEGCSCEVLLTESEDLGDAIDMILKNRVSPYTREGKPPRDVMVIRITNLLDVALEAVDRIGQQLSVAADMPGDREQLARITQAFLLLQDAHQASGEEMIRLVSGAKDG